MTKKVRTEAQRPSPAETRKSTEISEILAEAENRVRDFFSAYDNNKDAPVVQRKKAP